MLCLRTPPKVEREATPVKEKKGRWSLDSDNVQAADVIEDIRTAAPEYIGIGNSMMYTRLGKTPEAVSALTGKKFHFIYKSGSDAPIWFLLMKNLVAASGVKPKAIILFTRDNEITAPYLARNTSNVAFLKTMRSATEPDLDAFMQKSAPEAALTGVLDRWLDATFSFPEWQAQTTQRVTDLAMDLGGGGAAKKAQRFVLSERFSLDHLRGDIGANMPETGAGNLKSGSFDAATDASLLPAMVRVARECGAKLVVFRIKRRPDAETHLPEEPATMRDYSSNLGTWLTKHDAVFFDETYDLSIHLTDYLDGDHIHPSRLDWYRGYFWQRMRGVLP